MDKPQPGYGFRWLVDGEIIPKGAVYQYGCQTEWRHQDAIGAVFRSSVYVPHRVPIDPGEGYEIVPADETECSGMEFTTDGIHWERASRSYQPRRVDEFPGLTFRRRKQSEWLDPKTVTPTIGDKVWIYHATYGALLTRYTGDAGKIISWRPVKPGEIPEAPKPAAPKKSQSELDDDASQAWYQNQSDTEDLLCELALRKAYIAGLRDGRAK